MVMKILLGAITDFNMLMVYDALYCFLITILCAKLCSGACGKLSASALVFSVTCIATSRCEDQSRFFCQM